MPIFLSKDALKAVPLSEQPIRQDQERDELKNPLLAGDAYLKELARTDGRNLPLTKGMDNPSVGRVGCALMVIRELYELQQNMPQLSPDPQLFDDDFEQAVLYLQSFANLTGHIPGKVDRVTLLAIDRFLQNEIYDYAKKKYLGNRTDAVLSFKSQNSASGIYRYELVVGTEYSLTIETNEKAIVNLIKKSGDIGNQDVLHGYPTNTLQDSLMAHPDYQKLAADPEITGVKPGNPIGIKTKDLFIDTNAAGFEIPAATAHEFAESIPRQQVTDEKEEPYEVKENDNFSDIVIQRYYNQGPCEIRNPYHPEEVIFTFPNRVPSPPEARGKDARFQFYLHLLYYYNSTETEEFGMKRNTSGPNRYERFDPAILDTTNVFDNRRDTSDPQTALPNYYRFLQKMEQTDSARRIKFDQNGNTLSFLPDPGKNIIIPSQKVADTLYAFLNFRQHEMTKIVEIEPDTPGGPVRYKSEFVAPSVIEELIAEIGDTIESISDSIGEFFGYVKTETEELLDETYQLFVETYEFATEWLTQFWPRGMGARFNKDVKVTFGAMVGGAQQRHIYRDMSPANVLNLVYTEETRAKLGAEVGAGAGIAFYSGSGKRRKSLGIGTFAEASAFVQSTLVFEYTFPVRPNEPGVLAAILMAYGGVIGGTLELMRYVGYVNINPRHYLTKMSVKVDDNIEAWAAASAGFSSGHNNIIQENTPSATNGVETATQQDHNKSFGSVDNIHTNLWGIGTSVSGSVSLGIGCLFEVEYDDDSTQMDIGDDGARIFKSLSLEYELYGQFQLDIGLVGELLKKLLGVFSTTASSFFTGFLNALEAGVDMCLGLRWRYDRNDRARTILKSDMDLVNGSIARTLTGNAVQFDTTGSSRVTKRVEIYFGLGTGDVEEIAETGSSVKILLNASRLKEIWESPSASILNLNNALSVLGHLELRKKIGFGYDGKKAKEDTHRRKKALPPDLTNKVWDKFMLNANESTEARLVRAFLILVEKNRKNSNWAFFGGVALDVQIEMNFQDILLLLKYTVRRLQHLESLNEGQVLNFIDLEEKQKKKIRDHIVAQAKLSAGLSDGDLISELGSAYYQKMFAETKLDNVVAGLNYWIEGKLSHTADHTTGLQRFINSFHTFSKFLEDGFPIDKERDFMVQEIIDMYSFTTDVVNLNVTLEAILGASYGIETEVAELLEAHIFATVGADLNYQPKLIKENKRQDLAVADAFFGVMEEIWQLMTSQSDNKRYGAKNAFRLLPE